MPGTVGEFDSWIMDFKSVAQGSSIRKRRSTTSLPHSSSRSPTRHSRASSNVHRRTTHATNSP
ncbi:BZ3501_MvSof-1269-A2-R1_Chr10-1g02388 [Microbotryum saponariae]|nr:BZ3501_MvSof-1269-A2-R1_Chr10-1g02388 [Microbotryum saponariae]